MEPLQDWKHVVVGVDLEPAQVGLTGGTQRAVDQALWIAARFGARVSFLHSTARDRYFDPVGSGYVVVGEGPRAEAMELLQGLVDRATREGLTAELVLDEQEPAELMRTFVERSRADLVVAGKRSREERDGRRLGRVSKRLLRTSPVPVWVTNAGHSGPVRTIVAATDFSPVSEAVVATAAHFAGRTGAALHVVHAVPIEFLPSADFGSESFQHRADLDQSERMSAARGRLEALRAVLPVPAIVHVLDRPPYDALRDYATEAQADVVALGTAARKGLAAFFIGNTAEWLVDAIDASLLVVPPPP
jgi:universal stress protein E